MGKKNALKAKCAHSRLQTRISYAMAKNAPEYFFLHFLKREKIDILGQLKAMLSF